MAYQLLKVVSLAAGCAFGALHLEFGTSGGSLQESTTKEEVMPGNIFYIIGVIVVVLFILGYLGLR